MRRVIEFSCKHLLSTNQWRCVMALRCLDLGTEVIDFTAVGFGATKEGARASARKALFAWAKKERNKMKRHMAALLKIESAQKAKRRR